MKSLIQIFILVLIVSSCKTKKDIPVVEEKKNVSPNVQSRDIPVAELGKMPRDERLRGPKIDPEQIVAELGMDVAQEKKFLEYWEKNQNEMNALRKESQGDREGMRNKIKEVRERGRKEVEAILTPEQYTQYKKILAKDRMKQRRGGN